MTSAKIALLPDRGVISVTGPDAEKLLQGVVTNDMDLLGSQPAIHAGLLTPQGKILFDFLVMKADGGFLLDVARDKAADLVKRLSLYKLRANVEIRDASSELVVFAMWGGNPTSNTRPDVTDPRLAELGIRFIALADAVKDHEAASNGESVPPADYHAHRISLGVPEGGKDYAFGDAFPHEALFDQLHGVSFDKGCYVGQEVVSRMEHRGTARKRVVPVVAEAPLPAMGTEITAGDQLIGTLGSSAGNRGLALLRLDRAAEMQTKGADLMAGPVKVNIELPPWAKIARATADHP
jgi:folate-binding protein YgfZ